MQNGGETPAATESAPKVEEAVTKQSYRIKVWRHLESNGLAMFPRPVYNRIPNFKGAQDAGLKLAGLEAFKNAKSVQVDPDKPQETVRILCLEQQKTLYVAVPGLQGGYLSRVTVPEGDDPRKVVSRKGMETHGTPIPIEETVSLDLVVMGCVAVSKEGYRIGKGRGFGDLEFGLLMHLKAIKPNVLVVTTVHDCQVFDTLPAELFGPHDVPIDIIVTPTQVIETQRMSQRPAGVLWHLLSHRRLKLIPALHQLRDIEMLAGRACALKEEDTDVEERPAAAPRAPRRHARRARTRDHKSHSEGEATEGENAKGDSKPRRNTRRRNSHKSKEGKENKEEGKEGKETRPRRSKRPPPAIDFSVKVSNIGPNMRVRELKAALAERGVKPQNMIWKGFRGFCYLHFFKTGPQKGEGDAAPALDLDAVVSSLQELSVQGAEEEEPRLLLVEQAPPRAPREKGGDEPEEAVHQVEVQ